MTTYHSRLRSHLGFVAGCVFVLLGSACLAPHARAQAADSRPITLNLRGAPVQPVLRALLHAARKNYALDAGIGSTVTVVVKDATFDQALAAVLEDASPPLTLTKESDSSSSFSLLIYHIRHRQPQAPPGPRNASTVFDIADRAGGAPAALPADQTPSHLTAAQAIQAAREFCRRIGQPVSAPGSATFPARAEQAPVAYWQPRWQVVFPDQATVQVAAATGVITYYRDDTPRPMVDPSPPAGTPLVLAMTMPQAEAVRLAKKALAATGQPEGAHFDIAGMSNLAYWSIGWERAYRGLLYQDEDEAQFEGVGATVDTRTGRIWMLEFDYPDPPLTRGVVAVTQDQATKTAQAHLAADSSVPKDVNFSGAKLRIARLDTDPARQAHAVWIVSFVYGPVRGRRVNDIWVDSASGKVIADKHLWAPNHF